MLFSIDIYLEHVLSIHILLTCTLFEKMPPVPAFQVDEQFPDDVAFPRRPWLIQKKVRKALRMLLRVIALAIVGLGIFPFLRLPLLLIKCMPGVLYVRSKE